VGVDHEGDAFVDVGSEKGAEEECFGGVAGGGEVFGVGERGLHLGGGNKN